MRDYHAAVNGDANVAVPPWGPDGSRVVSFNMPMKVPAMVAKMIGASECGATGAKRDGREGAKGGGVRAPRGS